jgi:hypothetical protein
MRSGYLYLSGRQSHMIVSGGKPDKRLPTERYWAGHGSLVI